MGGLSFPMSPSPRGQQGYDQQHQQAQRQISKSPRLSSFIPQFSPVPGRAQQAQPAQAQERDAASRQMHGGIQALSAPGLR